MATINKVLVLDAGKCTGCRSCELSCSVAREGVASLSQSRIKVIAFEDEDFNFPIFCQQCQTPYCALICPTRALIKNPDTGIVEWREEKCVGCKMCLITCPFGAISIGTKSKVLKCDLCLGDPRCVHFCEPKALIYTYSDELGAANRLVTAQTTMKSHKKEG